MPPGSIVCSRDRFQNDLPNIRFKSSQFLTAEWNEQFSVFGYILCGKSQSIIEIQILHQTSYFTHALKYMIIKFEIVTVARFKS